MTVPNDPAGAEEAIAADLLRLEREGHRTAIEMGPYSAFMIVALCQNMARNFSADDFKGEAFEMIGHTFDAYFESTAAGDFLAAGWTETAKARESKMRKDNGE